MNEIKVAIAVIHFADKYLLGYRNSQQHQGDRYEFIGGKVEANETPKDALIREIYEEIGLKITSDNLINKMGVLRHVYHDLKAPTNSKTVCLHVFRVQLSQLQFERYLVRNHGNEGQLLRWITGSDLISHRYPLPEANKTILQWLSLSDIITITQELELETVKEASDDINRLKLTSAEAWSDFYQKYLPANATVYVRLKHSDTKTQLQLVQQLALKRKDLKLIVGSELASSWFKQPRDNNSTQTKVNLPIAQHITEAQLNKLVSDDIVIDEHKVKSLVDLPLTASCHTALSLEKLNRLAQSRLSYNRSPVIGVYLSPVKVTQTHPENPALGWQGINQLALKSEVPVIALGGMAPNDLDTARQHGADKVAGIRQFLTNFR